MANQKQKLLSEIGLSESSGSISTRGLTLADGDVRMADDDAGEGSSVRRISFTAASSAPLMRNTYAGFVRETLDFKGLDPSRLKGKTTPLLDSHNTSSMRSVLANIVGFRIVKRNKVDVLEVDAEFNMRNRNSKAAFEQIECGLARNVSIGYAAAKPGGVEYIYHADRADWREDRDPAADVIYRDWLVTEVSLVPVPADNSVGLGRDFELELVRGHARFNATAGSVIMTDHTEQQEQVADEAIEQEQERSAPADEAIEQAAERAAERVAERAKAKAKRSDDEGESEKIVMERFDGSGLKYLAKQAAKLRAQGITEAEHQQLTDEASEGSGLSVEQVRSKCWALLEARDSKAVGKTGQGRSPSIHLRDAAHNIFDFNRLGRLLAEGGADKVDGRELDVVDEFKDSDDYQRKAPARMNKTHSVFIPLKAYHEDPAMRKLINSWHTPDSLRRYDVGASATGFAHDKFDEAWFTAALVNTASVLPYINFLPTELAQDLIGVTESGSIQTGFISTENAQRTESSGLTFGNRRLDWKMAYGRKDFSQQVLDQTNYMFGVVLNRLRRDLGRRIDEESLVGDSNTDGGFLGIMNYDSVTEIDSSSNDNDAGNITYKMITDMIATIEAANANAAASRFIMTPKVKAVLRRIQRQAGATGSAADVILSQQVGEMPTIDGYPVITTNVAGMKTQRRGTDTNNSEGLIFGDLSDITGAHFSATEMVVDPYSAMDYGQTRVYIRLALDIQPDHIASFCIAKVDPDA